MNLRYCYDVNGQPQRFVYDLKGQLTAVLDEQNKPVEAYRYDAAGNILEKTLDGQTTRYVYDKANQLVSSTVDGQETLYRYDAAGRLVQEGDKTYAYGYQDKILSVKENGKVVATFDYYLNGQLASVTRGSETETFYWDGLALVARGQTRYLNEPHAGGGAPILASGKTLFNDLLGNTLGVQEGGNYTPVKMTAFGETKTKEAFFTGYRKSAKLKSKTGSDRDFRAARRCGARSRFRRRSVNPFIGELGYAFLLRNYRPNHGKWQTADPLGYPDGWNNFAYCNNSVLDSVDWTGAWRIVVVGASSRDNVFRDGDGVIEDCVITAIQGASGSGTSQVTITCLGTFYVLNSLMNINQSISVSYSVTYTVDANGQMTAQRDGEQLSGDNNPIMIWGTGGGTSSLTIKGNFEKQTGGMTYKKFASVSVDGISLKVVE